MNWTFNIIGVIFVCFFVYMYIISASQWLYALECLFMYMETFFLTHVSEFGVFLIHSWSLNFSFKENMGKQQTWWKTKTNHQSGQLYSVNIWCCMCSLSAFVPLNRWHKNGSVSETLNQSWFFWQSSFSRVYDWVYDSLWLMYRFKSCVLKYLFWGQLGQLVLFILSSASVSCSVATVQRWHQLFYFKHTRVWVWKRWSKYLNCMAIWASTSQDHTTSLHTNKLSHTA